MIRSGTVQIGCAFTGPWDSAPPARCNGRAVGLAPERFILQGKGLPEAVINAIQSACVPSTSSLYAAKWGVWHARGKPIVGVAV